MSITIGRDRDGRAVHGPTEPEPTTPPGRIAVIVASFNRPRMLAECLASITGADQVIVADDGSDFDVEALAARFDLPELVVVANEPRSPQRRMLEPSCGKLLNRATAATSCDYLLPVCDDDLLAPGWPAAARAGLDYYRAFHMVRGDWRRVNDGEPLERAPLCRFEFALPLTTGNFAYRRSCATEEGCVWSERTLAVHDAVMLGTYITRHSGPRPSHNPAWLGSLDLLAGYRREHPHTITNNASSADHYAPRMAALFAAGAGGME